MQVSVLTTNHLTTRIIGHNVNQTNAQYKDVTEQGWGARRPKGIKPKDQGKKIEKSESLIIARNALSLFFQ
jgi:hypothetical protein